MTRPTPFSSWNAIKVNHHDETGATSTVSPSLGQQGIPHSLSPRDKQALLSSPASLPTHSASPSLPGIRPQAASSRNSVPTSTFNPPPHANPSQLQARGSLSIRSGTSLPAGLQQLATGQLLSPERPLFNTPSSQPLSLFSAAPSTTASQTGGGGSGGGGGTFRAAAHIPQSPSQSNTNSPLSPTSNSNANNHIVANSPSGNQSGQLSKIVVAQVFLLLSTIKEDKDRTKWDSQVEQIRKLIESNGMEVFSKYFRRLLVGNSPQIFPGISKPVENPGNYPLLVGEIRKITHDPEQARRIAESVDTSDGDLFKDFDLLTFMTHFKLDPVETTLLALAFESTSRSDLRTKASAILSNNFRPLLEVLSSSASNSDNRADLPALIVARIVEGLIQHPPSNLNDDIVDLRVWARMNSRKGSQELVFFIVKFLTVKAEDEMTSSREEHPTQKTMSLTVKTVNAMLEILEDSASDERRDELVALQRLCIQAYPRLINYGEGFDSIIDANGNESNAMPDNIDKLMREHYEAMYNGERDVRDIVEALQMYKNSQEPAQQDLFACMIHGLFDEYSCYHGYPPDPLATTAVLLGAIINFNLISGIPLRVGLGMVLEAVRDYGPESAMYKFGLQALLHFFNRLHEWPGFCRLLLEVPGLQGTEAYAKAAEVVQQSTQPSAGAEEATDLPHGDGMPDGIPLTNGSVADTFAPNSVLPPFSSIHVDPPRQDDSFEDPSEDVQDKVLFALNNLSEQNLELKIQDLMEALRERDYGWLARYLVEERAKMQPNFHQLYLDMLNLFANKRLWSEVLRETYVGIIRMLNAQATLDSSAERSHLKNLGGWLGSLTLARDRPIKYKNISFSDLLIEAYESQRLIIAIPFSCRVLAHASKSMVFRPPNPWLMEIIALLIELYHFAELRLQLKFEIEVLCKDLSLDHRSIEPSTTLRERPRRDEELSGAALPEGLDGFDELSLAGLIRPSGRNERFSPGAITASLPDIGTLLVYPPMSNTGINRETLREVVETAVRRAIQEIISPVVERSVTIAAISTAQLIHKDFAMEPDEDRVRQSALTMVKALAGSLALVTCKEPLRMSMTNNIRVLSAEVEEQALPEGAILMCVNDNLDAACSLVESAAEQRSMPEIEENIEQQLAARRRHRASRTAEPYVDPIVNRWAFYIPEPYKQSPNGLNKDQLAIYEDFARQSRGPSAHMKASSTDSGRNIVNEVLQDQFSTVPSISTPAEPPALPYQAPQPQFQRVQPPPSVPTQVAETPQVNGFVRTPAEQIQEFLFDLQRAAREGSETLLAEVPGNPLWEIRQQILRSIEVSPHRDHTALAVAKRVFQALYGPAESSLEIEVLVLLLKEMCERVSLTHKEVTLWLIKEEEEPAFNVQVTMALLDAGLLDLQLIDLTTSRALQRGNIDALNFMADLLDQVLLSDQPIALRADFANSLEALGQWLTLDPKPPTAERLVQKLHEHGIPEIVNAVPEQRVVARCDQIRYTFSEWTRLYSRAGPVDKSIAAFVSQLYHQHLLNSEDEASLFFRVCIDMAVDTSEEGEDDATAHFGDPILRMDALAKLVLLLLRYRGQDDEEAEDEAPAYLNSLLSLIVLVLNHHHLMRGESFSQRLFFRFFSSLLCEYHAHRDFLGEGKDMMLVISNTFLALQPVYFPAFAFGWLSLVSHRYFMPGMLLLPDQAGWEPYAKLMKAMLSYVGELLKPLTSSRAAKDIYRGVLRILLVLHHDFPEFLAENHYRLCGAIPAHCTQLRNLILSAYPSSFPELPDPFTAGLKVDRINEIRTSPRVAGDFEGPLRRSSIKQLIAAALDGVHTEDHISQIAEAITNPPRKEAGIASAPVDVDVELVNALVLFIGTRAIALAGQKGGPTFVQNSPEAIFLVQIAHKLNPEARYYFLSAVANHLRYPNSHTHYFSYALLYLFGIDQNDQRESDIKQQITRVLLERLIVHRPHPWGLIITLLELLKNPIYSFWDLPFIKAAPEIERLFNALFQHINQSPR